MPPHAIYEDSASSPTIQTQFPIRTPEEVAHLRKAGKLSAQVLHDLSPHIKPGTTKYALDQLARDLIENKYGCEINHKSATGYNANPDAAISFSHNDICFNGETDEVPLRTGDMFGIHVSVKKDDYIGESSRCWIVGDECSSRARMQLAVAYQATCLAISLIKPGAKSQDIALRVQHYVEGFGFSMLRLPREYGSSKDGHMRCYVDHHNEVGVLLEGMIVTVAPYTSARKRDSLESPNKTVVTADGSAGCYWKHVVVVTKSGCEVLDLREDEDVRFYDGSGQRRRRSSHIGFSDW